MDRKKLLMYGGIGVLVVVLVGAVVGLFMGERGVTVTISDTAVTNVRPTSTTIVWTTKESLVGSVLVSEDGNFPSGMFANYEGMEFFDDRDVSEVEPGVFEIHDKSGLIPGYTHHVTIRGLEPEKTYYFALKHEDRIDIPEENTFTTVPVLGQVYTPEPMYGVLMSEEGMGIADGLVLIEREGVNGISQVLSTYLAPNGSYSLDVAGAYDSGFEGLYTSEQTDKFKMRFMVDIDREVVYDEYEAESDKVQPVGILTIKVEDEISYINEYLMSFVGQAEARMLMDDFNTLPQEVKNEVKKAGAAPVYTAPPKAPTVPKKEDKKEEDEPKCKSELFCDGLNVMKRSSDCKVNLSGKCSISQKCMAKDGNAWCDDTKQTVQMLVDDLIALGNMEGEDGEKLYNVGNEIKKAMGSQQADVLIRNDVLKDQAEELVKSGDRELQKIGTAIVERQKEAEKKMSNNHNECGDLWKTWDQEKKANQPAMVKFLSKLIPNAFAQGTQWDNGIDEDCRARCAVEYVQSIQVSSREVINNCVDTHGNIFKEGDVVNAIVLWVPGFSLGNIKCVKNRSNQLVWDSTTDIHNIADSIHLPLHNQNALSEKVGFGCRVNSRSCLSRQKSIQCVGSGQTATDVNGVEVEIGTYEGGDVIEPGTEGYECRMGYFAPVLSETSLGGCSTIGATQCKGGILHKCNDNHEWVEEHVDYMDGTENLKLFCDGATGKIVSIADKTPNGCGGVPHGAKKCDYGRNLILTCQNGFYETVNVCGMETGGAVKTICEQSGNTASCVTPPASVKDGCQSVGQRFCASTKSVTTCNLDGGNTIVGITAPCEENQICRSGQCVGETTNPCGSIPVGETACANGAEERTCLSGATYDGSGTQIKSDEWGDDRNCGTDKVCGRKSNGKWGCVPKPEVLVDADGGVWSAVANPAFCIINNNNDTVSFGEDCDANSVCHNGECIVRSKVGTCAGGTPHNAWACTGASTRRLCDGVIGRFTDTETANPGEKCNYSTGNFYTPSGLSCDNGRVSAGSIVCADNKKQSVCDGTTGKFVTTDCSEDQICKPGEGCVDPPEASAPSNIFNIFTNFIFPAKAQENTQIEPDSRRVGTTGTMLEAGVYELQSINGQTSTVEFVNGGSIQLYHDLDGNGVRDYDEPFIFDEYVGVKQIAEVVNYSLNIGWNLLSFPMSITGENTSEIKTAGDLIDSINKQGGEVTHVTTYRGGKFVVYSERKNGEDTITFGTNFNLIPGEAYFVRSLTLSGFSVMGQKVEGSLPVNLEKGWNLVGIYNSAKESLGGFEVINQMNTQGVLARILSKWQDGGYQNLVVRDGVEYGNDYQVFPQSGYWVQNAGDGSGVYKPE
jgi:hypothetical protein